MTSSHSEARVHGTELISEFVKGLAVTSALLLAAACGPDADPLTASERPAPTGGDGEQNQADDPDDPNRSSLPNFGFVDREILGTAAPLHASDAYGLAFDSGSSPHRLYVSDNTEDRIYAYEVDGEQLWPLPSAGLATNQLDPSFIAPRDLAFAWHGPEPYLYALTNGISGSVNQRQRPSRLWKVNLSNHEVDHIDLDCPAFGIEGLEVFGLAQHSGRMYLSYDTSDLPSAKEQVSQGILVLRVADDDLHQQWWSKAKACDGSAVLRHLPHSGRKTSGSTYGRAPAFGLAVGGYDGTSQLWATSYWKYLYGADLETGRGLFSWSSPGSRKIHGLAFGDGYLWAVDRIEGQDVIHRVSVQPGNPTDLVGTPHVRTIRMQLTSTALAPILTADVRHHFARPLSNAKRPNQGRDLSSLDVQTSDPATLATKYYDPAGDTSSRQRYYQLRYEGNVGLGQSLDTTVEIDVWTSDRRQLIYPHIVDSVAAPSSGYLADSYTVYRHSEAAAYDAFLAAVRDATAAKYGDAMANSTNPYWIARNILEFIKEQYDYGNVSDTSEGHYSYNPASFKIQLPLDGTAGNEKMSCSSSSFALVGALRYAGVPARWVGTTKRRNNWDDDDDGYMTGDESALDTSFHRWAEVWLGSSYGWQRFDPTPSGDGPRVQSQYELMSCSAAGVKWTDLVLQAGSGYHDAFYRAYDHNQRYNSVPKYDSPSFWTDTTYRHIEWRNACNLSVDSVGDTVAGPTVNLSWEATGRWDMDPNATLNIYVRRMLSVNNQWNPASSRTQLASDLPATLGLGGFTVNLEDTCQPDRYYRIEIEKAGDNETGTIGEVFTYSPQSG